MGRNVLNDQVLAIARSTVKNLTKPLVKKMKRNYGIDGEVIFDLKYTPINLSNRRETSQFEVEVTYLEKKYDNQQRVLIGKFTNNKLTELTFQIEPGRMCEDRIRITQLSRIIGHAFADEIKGK